MILGTAMKRHSAQSPWNGHRRATIRDWSLLCAIAIVFGLTLMVGLGGAFGGWPAFGQLSP